MIRLRAYPSIPRVMQKEQQKYFTTRLSTLEDNERRKLYKRASQLRKVYQSRHKPQEDENIRRSKSLDDFVLQLLLEEDAEQTSGPATGQGLVIWLGPKSCQVQTEQGIVSCQLSRSQPTAIGDRLTYRPHGDGYIVVTVLPRTTVLSRPDVDNGNVERVIAANVDVVVVVVSVVAPPLHPKIIDRYMVAVQRGGARLLLAVNKADLLNATNRMTEEAKLEPYRESVPIILCSTTNGLGIDALRTMLQGQTCAFVGHSGVGKSSLINAFEPSLALDTGSVSEGYGRGTHTTTASTLHSLKGGTQLIDTPGVRSFGLWDVDAKGLAWYFPEFDEFRSRCKFNDCSHTHEPSCEIKLAVAKGQLSKTRYDSYLRILTSL